MSRTFEDKPAVRASVPLLVGLMGPSGSGKTWTALEAATGIQEVVGGDIYVIDTEARRALHYADYFRFRHVEFKAPFRSLDYLAAIEYCVSKGAKTIVVDSMSHEHAGPGGYLEFAEAELDRMAGSDWKKRERCKLASFIKPSAERRKMVDGITTTNTNFIFCFRAKEKVKPSKENGKTEIVNLGFMPIAGTELVFEMTMCALLMPGAKGVPTWHSEDVGEKMMIKSPQQFRDIFREGEAINRNHGRKLAEWAKGRPAAAPSEPIADLSTYRDIGDSKATQGTKALQEWWASLPPEVRKQLKSVLDTEWKPLAADCDQGGAE